MKALKRSHTSPSSSSHSSSPPSSSSSSSLSISSWTHLRSVLFVVTSSSPASRSSSSSSDRGRIKSPWSRRRRKHALSPQQWTNLFAPNGKLLDVGGKLLKIVRSGGVDPSIRAEVWQFLLGVYDFDSSKEERELVRNHKRKEYESIRKQCRLLLKNSEDIQLNEDMESLIADVESYSSDDVVSARESLSSEARSTDDDSEKPSSELLDGEASSRQITNADSSILNTDSSDSDSGEESGTIPPLSPLPEERKETNPGISIKETHSKPCTIEDFATWQRIIRLDAVRANVDWISYAPSQAAISDGRARRSADAVGLKDYDLLEPCRIFHAARLVAILEAYALYDPEIGYCQGMSDLLSPIIAFMENDHEAFWCFVGFMKKARHNFRLDEMGIRRQLSIVSKIIKQKDAHLYRHLEKLQAEDCFFVYRMVVVLFRRELTFEQTVCLWEVMWADQAAIRAGIGKSAWSRIRQRAPPTEDLVLYAIAASVLQRRKLIIEKYSSMDEIIKECNNMAGQLDVWKLLDDAHNLVVTLHDKVETPFDRLSKSISN